MTSPPFARTGLALAVTALAVNGPRLILAFLEADGLVVPAGWRATMLGVTGVASGVVLTGGGAYLAHALARGARFRRTLAGAWILVLLGSAVLVTPMLVAGLGRLELGEVLPDLRARWIWSATAVLVVEVVAAGAMVAHAAGRLEQEAMARIEEELLEVARERDRLQKRVAELEQEEAATEGSIPAVACRNGCGRVFSSAHAERGHQRSCRRSPPSEAGL